MKKTKFNKKDLTMFGSLIKNRLNDERKQLKSTGRLLQDHESYQSRDKNDNDHDASVIRNEEMLRTMHKRAKRRVRKLEDALGRIDAKTYGRCHMTGKMISKDRLLVLPEARLSMAAKRM